MKRTRHENLKSAVSTYLKRRNYTTTEVTFRRSEFAKGISLQELVKDEELKTVLAQENVICLNSMGPELSTLDNQLSRLKSWLGGLPPTASQELSQLVPVVLSQMYLEAVASGASRLGALKFLKRHHTPAIQPDELLDEMVAAGTCSELLTRPSIVRFRAGRTLVTASQQSLILLESFLASNELGLLLQVVGQWVQFVSSSYGEEIEEPGSNTAPQPMELSPLSENTTHHTEDVDAEVAALEAVIQAAKDGPLVPMPLRIFCVMNCEGNPISCGGLGNKANLLCTGSESGAVGVWSLTQDCLSSGLSCQQLLGHTAPIRSVCWLGSKAVLSGSVDHDIKLWPSEDFTTPTTYRGHMGSVYGLAMSPLNTYFASASADLSLKLWSPEFAFPLRTYAAHTQPPLCVDFHPNGLYVASGSRDTTVRLWATTEGRLVRLFSGHRAGVRCVAFSPDGTSLASGGVEPIVRIWDLAQGSCRLELTASPHGTTQIVWSEDCSNLAAASPDGTVSVWDLTKESRSCMASYATGTLAVLALHFTGHNLTCVGTAP